MSETIAIRTPDHLEQEQRSIARIVVLTRLLDVDVRQFVDSCDAP
jgi:hypothetical protein